MRKITLIIIVILSGLRAVPQDNNVQIPIETEFKNGMIIFTLPSPYSSPEYRPMAIPRFVTTLRTMKLPPYSPSKAELISELKRRLSVSQQKTDKDIAMEYLKNIALYIYLNNNDTSAIPQQARTSLAEWSKANISFKEEVKLVVDYLKMADNM